MEVTGVLWLGTNVLDHQGRDWGAGVVVGVFPEQWTLRGMDVSDTSGQVGLRQTEPPALGAQS